MADDRSDRSGAMPGQSEPRKVRVRSSAEREERAQRRQTRRQATEEQAKQVERDVKATTAAPSEPKKKRKSRSQVCPKCGKYYEVTDLPVGHTVECYCGAEFTVKPPTEKTAVASESLELIEMRKKRSVITVGMVIAGLVGIGVLSFAVWRTVDAGVSAATVFAYFLAVLFLVATFAISSERKRLREAIDDAS